MNEEEYEKEIDKLIEKQCKGCLNAEMCIEEEWHDNPYDVLNCPYGKWKDNKKRRR